MEPITHISGDRPAGQGLPPEFLRQISELHELVRAWAEVGSRTGAGPVRCHPTVAYLDLMFAYGLARLGEVQQSAELANTARTALDTLPADDASGLAAQFLVRAFQYRIDQVAAGHPPFGRLSLALYDDLDEIDQRSKYSDGRRMSTSPHGMAHFIITHMLAQSRILEPFERPDPYKMFTANHEGGLKQELYELLAECDPERLPARVRELYRRAGADDSRQGTASMTEGQFDVLRDCLPLAGRVGAEFAAELLRIVPDALRQSFPKQKDPLIRKAHLLERGLSLVERFRHRELAGQLVDAFTELVVTKTDDDRLHLINRVTGLCIHCLRTLGMRDDLDELLQRLLTAVLGQGSLNDLKAKCVGRPEQWLNALETLLHIAGGWLACGLTDQANPILDEARNGLLSPPGKKSMPQDNTRLAKAYIAAVSQGPTEGGLHRIGELFRKIDPNKITNAFVTAPFFSRLHLNVAEEVVLAILQMRPYPSPPSAP